MSKTGGSRANHTSPVKGAGRSANRGAQKSASRASDPRGNEDFPWDMFDPSSYVDDNYTTVHNEDFEIIQRIREFFAAEVGNRSLKRGVDVGTGPNIYPAMTMLPFCAEITLIERGAANRAWLWRELESYSPHWDAFWELLRENPRYGAVADPRLEIKRRTRVMPGDVFRLDPRQPWDMGTMFFVAESISFREREFQLATRRFMGALRAGAPFAASFMRNSRGYTVGGDFFPAVAVSELDVRDCLSRVAYDVETVAIESATLQRKDYDGMILALGKAGHARG